MQTPHCHSRVLHNTRSYHPPCCRLTRSISQQQDMSVHMYPSTGFTSLLHVQDPSCCHLPRPILGSSSSIKMGSTQEHKVAMATTFIDTRAPGFHPAFGAGSKLDRDSMTYEPDTSESIADLKDTLECHQKTARRYVDFADDVLHCTWDHVHEQLQKAKAAEEESQRRGRNMARKTWRSMGTTGSILAPGLSAIPDDLCVLHGGLAVIFSVRASPNQR